MARSLKIQHWYIPTVKAALRRNGYTSQKDLAYNLELSVDTIHKFLNGKPIDTLNFIEVSKALGFDWQEIADIEEYGIEANKEEINKSDIPLELLDQISERENIEVLALNESVNHEDSLESLAQQNVEILVTLFKSMRQQLPDTISDEVVAELVKTALTEANITKQSQNANADKDNIAFTLQSKLDSGKYKTVQGIFNTHNKDLKEGRVIKSKKMDQEMQNLHRNNELVIYE